MATQMLNRRDFVSAGLGLACLGAAGGLLVGCGGGSGAGAGAGAGAGVSSDTSQAASRALKGNRWALVVDVEKLQANDNLAQIIAACNKAHNIPAITEQNFAVKWIWAEDFEHTFLELENGHQSQKLNELSLPVLCNHCDNPSCVRVCPTQATFKRDDGIVDMDYHRCIGCRYCMTACPYDARSMNFYDPRDYLEELDANYPTRSIGVVEKCTLCVERIDQGLEPICAEASAGAIIFGDLDDPTSSVCKALEGGFSLRRRAELSTAPSVYYLFKGGELNA